METPRQWTSADLRCSREALGCSRTELADWLGWKQTRISECEGGKRKVPDWLPVRMAELEQARDTLVSRMLFAMDAADGAHPLVHRDSAAYAAAHGTDLPASVQRVAAALAVGIYERSHGIRPPIMWADEAGEITYTR
jgi:hypothetical protein